MTELTYEARRDPAGDEHALCACGGLMAYNHTGALVCQDCGTSAIGPDQPAAAAPLKVYGAMPS